MNEDRIQKLKDIAQKIKEIRENKSLVDEENNLRKLESLRATYANLTNSVRDVDWKNFGYSPLAYASYLLESSAGFQILFACIGMLVFCQICNDYKIIRIIFLQIICFPAKSFSGYLSPSMLPVIPKTSLAY